MTFFTQTEIDNLPPPPLFLLYPNEVVYRGYDNFNKSHHLYQVMDYNEQKDEIIFLILPQGEAQSGTCMRKKIKRSSAMKKLDLYTDPIYMTRYNGYVASRIQWNKQVIDKYY